MSIFFIFCQGSLTILCTKSNNIVIIIETKTTFINLKYGLMYSKGLKLALKQVQDLTLDPGCRVGRLGRRHIRPGLALIGDLGSVARLVVSSVPVIVKDFQLKLTIGFIRKMTSLSSTTKLPKSHIQKLRSGLRIHCLRSFSASKHTFLNLSK